MDSWSEANEAALLELWNAGLSASRIGDRLGITRNAVLGKVHRMRERKGQRAPAPRPIAKHINRGGRPRPKAPPHPMKITRHENVVLMPKVKAIAIEAPVLPADAWGAGADDGLIGPPAIFVGGGLTILELDNSTCRWPGADRPWRFCGAAVDAGSRYCLHHRIRGRQ